MFCIFHTEAISFLVTLQKMKLVFWLGGDNAEGVLRIMWFSFWEILKHDYTGPFYVRQQQFFHCALNTPFRFLILHDIAYFMPLTKWLKQALSPNLWYLCIKDYYLWYFFQQWINYSIRQMQTRCWVSCLMPQQRFVSEFRGESRVLCLDQ